MNLRHVLANAARQLRTEGLLSTIDSLSERAQVRWKEWRLGIRTEGYIELSELGFDNKECNYYSATSYADFPRIMRALAIDPRQHVFLDYGAGMGRAMVLAAGYPFKRVIGVEIAPELTALAKENLARCRGKLKCQDLSVVTVDATLYDIPSDVTIVYIVNAFNGLVLAKVLQNIRAFGRRATAPVLVACNVPPRSGLEDQIRAHRWLTLRGEWPLAHARRLLIFSTSDDAQSGGPAS